MQRRIHAHHHEILNGAAILRYGDTTASPLAFFLLFLLCAATGFLLCTTQGVLCLWSFIFYVDERWLGTWKGRDMYTECTAKCIYQWRFWFSSLMSSRMRVKGEVQVR